MSVPVTRATLLGRINAVLPDDERLLRQVKPDGVRYVLADLAKGKDIDIEEMARKLGVCSALETVVGD